MHTGAAATTEVLTLRSLKLIWKKLKRKKNYDHNLFSLLSAAAFFSSALEPDFLFTVSWGGSGDEFWHASSERAQKTGQQTIFVRSLANHRHVIISILLRNPSACPHVCVILIVNSAGSCVSFCRASSRFHIRTYWANELESLAPVALTIFIQTKHLNFSKYLREYLWQKRARVHGDLEWLKHSQAMSRSVERDQ